MNQGVEVGVMYTKKVLHMPSVFALDIVFSEWFQSFHADHSFSLNLGHV